MVALDIATGGGHTAKYLAAKVKRIIATDLTKEMLAAAKDHLKHIDNIVFAEADAEQLPYPDNHVDIVTCRIAAHHFPSPQKFVAEARRVLKKNGKFLLVDNVASEYATFDFFINKMEKMRDPSHVRSLNISEWEALFENNGLQLLYEQKRKKNLPYQEWVSRMMSSQEDIQNVTNFILQSPQEIQNYYQIVYDTSGDIVSFSLDEWVAVCKKNISAGMPIHVDSQSFSLKAKPDGIRAACHLV
ncbi:class I SAM-dependent methyltransferase [Virgibacillus halophilus]|uniref:Class I SAM-dependent methyltransferase n=1 Tax=Tigheibacillus halophilus TaxID=361280 RepID=A0ABU5CAS8_9BACI|nr:class I SAM-dependent methyltransferase [Virgibacillus halophilus]